MRKFIIIIFLTILSFMLFLNTEVYGQARRLGDINNDGVVGLRDLAILQTHIVKLHIISEENIMYADINQDNRIDALDVSLMCQMMVGLREINEAIIENDDTDEILDVNENRSIKLIKITNRDNENYGISWSSSNEKVAKVDKEGLVEGVGNGTATITAKTEDGDEISCKITVQTSPEKIELDKTDEIIDLSENKIIELKSTIEPNTVNINNEINWSSSDNKIAKVNENGLVEGISNGTAIITVKTANNKKATCKITVQTSPEKISLNKTEETLDFSKTRTLELKSKIEPSTVNENNEITWSSSDESIAIVDESGLVKVIENGTAIITAKTANGKEAICKITVKNKPEGIIDLSETRTIKLISVIESDNDITWSSSDEKVAKVDKEGLVEGISNGIAILTERSEEGEEITYKITVQTSPEKIELEKTEEILDLSGTNSIKLVSTIEPKTANVNNGITYSSSNEKVVKVNKEGLVEGIGNGTATITAKTANGKTATCEITVQTSPTKITLNKTKATLDLSGTKSIKLVSTIEPKTANVNNGITYSSSNEKVVKVNKEGLVEGIGNGTATITVKTANGKTATCEITVQTSPTKITLNKTKATLDLSGTKSIKLVSTIEPKTANVNNGITYSSNNEKVAKVNKEGLVEGIGNGTATITVKTSKGKKAVCKVTVQTSPTKINLNKESIDPLDTINTISVTFEPNTTNQKEVTWTSSDEKVATVDSRGRVTPKSIGTAKITATSKANKKIQATCTVTVKNNVILMKDGNMEYQFIPVTRKNIKVDKGNVFNTQQGFCLAKGKDGKNYYISAVIKTSGAAKRELEANNKEATSEAVDNLRNSSNTWLTILDEQRNVKVVITDYCYGHANAITYDSDKQKIYILKFSTESIIEMYEVDNKIITDAIKVAEENKITILTNENFDSSKYINTITKSDNNMRLTGITYDAKTKNLYGCKGIYIYKVTIKNNIAYYDYIFTAPKRTFEGMKYSPMGIGKYENYFIIVTHKFEGYKTARSILDVYTESGIYKGSIAFTSDTQIGYEEIEGIQSLENGIFDFNFNAGINSISSLDLSSLLNKIIK